jgi:hypothetical protein
LLPSGDRLASHEGATAAGGPAWSCCPTGGAGIVVLVNSDGSAPIDAVVQQWVALLTQRTARELYPT